MGGEGRRRGRGWEGKVEEGGEDGRGRWKKGERMGGEGRRRGRGWEGKVEEGGEDGRGR